MSIGLLRKLQNFLPKAAPITIYKAFIRPYLNCSDIIHVQVYKMTFHQKFEFI